MADPGLGPVDDPAEVDAEHPVDVSEGHRLDVGDQGHAGVVDHQVDLAVLGHDPVRPLVDGVTVGDVDPVRRHLRAPAAAAQHGLGQPLLVDVGEGQVRTPARQLDRECLPDA